MTVTPKTKEAAIKAAQYALKWYHEMMTKKITANLRKRND